MRVLLIGPRALGSGLFFAAENVSKGRTATALAALSNEAVMVNTGACLAPAVSPGLAGAATRACAHSCNAVFWLAGRLA